MFRKLFRPLKWVLILVILVAIMVIGFAGTKQLGVTHLEITTDRLPEAFDGMVIAQVSDLHNWEFGHENSTLIKRLEEIHPDFILITGDLVEGNNVDIDRGIAAAAKMAKIAPTFFAAGNHEARMADYETAKKGLEDVSVVVLDEDLVRITRKGQQISFIGLLDPEFESVTGTVAERIAAINPDEDQYRILLSHRPELFDEYCEAKVDLVFTGHTHGGQIRIPYLGAIYAPNQGFFPKYAFGHHQEGRTHMIISRGLGSHLPLRIDNPPEIVAVTLHSGGTP